MEIVLKEASFLYGTDGDSRTLFSDLTAVLAICNFYFSESQKEISGGTR